MNRNNASDLVKLHMAEGAGNTTRPLTHSLDSTKEGLAVNATRDEEWRSIPGCEGVYEVSNLGSIRSLARTVSTKNGRTYRVASGALKPTPHKKSGHLTVSLAGRTLSVHRIVAEAFLGLQPDQYVKHVDLNKANNDVENLVCASKSTPIEERFKGFLPSIRGNGDCWVWMGPIHPNGYGTLGKRAGSTTRASHEYAHRVSYEIHRGPIPAAHEVMHTCDNRPCVNPAHLMVGTHAENMTDMGNKGRAYRGGVKPKSATSSQLGPANMDIHRANEIRSLHAGGLGVKALADQFQISDSFVYGIVRELRWRNDTTNDVTRSRRPRRNRNQPNRQVTV